MFYNYKQLIKVGVITNIILSIAVGAVSSQRTEMLENDIPEHIVEEAVLLEQSAPVEETPPISEAIAETLEKASKHTYFDVPLSEDIQDHIFELCEKTGLDASMVVAMIFVESTYRSDLIGDNGKSFGLMQIQPRWHSKRMSALGCDDLLDPYQNIIVGIDYISELYTYGGKKRTTDWVLMAYNGGPSYANKKTAQGVVTHYVNKVYNKQATLTEV